MFHLSPYLYLFPDTTSYHNDFFHCSQNNLLNIINFLKRYLNHLFIIDSDFFFQLLKFKEEIQRILFPYLPLQLISF